MATHPTILGDLARGEMEPEKDSSLDVERDLGIHEGEPDHDATAPPPEEKPHRPGNDDEDDGA